MGAEAALTTALMNAGAPAFLVNAASYLPALGSIGTAASVLGGISSIAGGASANAEAKRQAGMATFQAQQQGAESARLAQREASAISQEAESTRRAQKVAYLKSGVTLEGSPLLVMEGTRVAGQQNVEEALRAGGSAAGSAYAEGRIRAQNAKASGRQAFTSGLTGAASLFKSAF